MALSGEDGYLSFQSNLYEALMSGDENRVIQLCERVPEGPLYPLTIHNDTVLHMATYSKQENLVLRLLDKLPQSQNGKMDAKNDIGNTILHEAATSSKIVPAARAMLGRAPYLLEMRNERGETALFRAARYGKMEMFRFLDEQVKESFKSKEEEKVDKELFEKALKEMYVRDDKTTVLHICVLTEHFAAKGESWCRVPLWEEIKRKRRGYDSAVKLAEFLIEKDTSWKKTESALDQSKPRIHKFGATSLSHQGQGSDKELHTPIAETSVDIAETPLLLAAKSGILEIVKGILTKYPQAVEHIDDEGRNVLHVAIKYRQLHIFDFIEKNMDVPMMRLVRKIDNQGNSILHMVGIKGDHSQRIEDMRSPALILREDLLLFERVKKICTNHFIRHLNNDGHSAEKLFADNNATLRESAKEWIKRTGENCSIVAVLIATVAFAAAYTVPGGPNQNTGYPLLLNQSFFIIFTLSDALSLTSALTSVITFLSVLTSSFQLKDFRRSLPQKLLLGVTLLILSVSMMMLAFAATIILLISNKQQWTRIVLYSVAFLPVSIFAISYLPLYVELVRTFFLSVRKVGDVFPRFNCGYLRSRISSSTSFSKSRSSLISNPTRSQAKDSTRASGQTSLLAV
ncbi:ankyrin repeat-containing protein ITN1-like isoform X2 [Diospyros lotus]|uniref:ankyrin repeat-containing protein ITN1-like isoform X2 n=1 Tax=Diospyros lotus TaxID=55363 RepID=UPI00224FF75C|nr:ankyrin repeat-containing protein ITN1-like isoform X2 [Diospyros lotus]